MTALFPEGFLLGLSTGFYCLASCLPFIAPYILAEGGKGWSSGLFIFLQFTAGRLAAYTLFALLATLAGKTGQYAFPGWLVPACMLACGLLMSILAIFRVSGGGLCLFKRDLGPVFRRLPIAMGFATGLNICPPFAAGFIRLVEIADIPRGLCYFGGFFAATTIFTSPVLLGTPWSGPRVNAIGRLTLLIAGLWYTGLGLSGLYNIFP